jgi:L-gulonate 5-dehydrogenase
MYNYPFSCHFGEESMKGAVLTAYGRFQWKNLPRPEPGENDVLVKIEYAGICGSDLHVFHGDFQPRTVLPFVPGHEFAGRVEETGNHVQSFRAGDAVVADPIVWCGRCAACRTGHYPACSSLKLIGIDTNGGFAEYASVPEKMLYRIPEGIPARHAALVELYSIGFHACRRADLKPEDTVAIWGTGRVGQSILQAARTVTKHSVFCIDVLDSRLAGVKKTFPGVETINAAAEDPVSRILELTEGRGVDTAFEAVGHAAEPAGIPNPVRGCVLSIRGGGTVCVLGLGDIPAPVLFKELIWKEAKIVASRVSHGEFSEAIRRLSAGDLKPDALISAEFHGAEAQKAFEALENEPEKYLKIMLKFAEG